MKQIILCCSHLISCQNGINGRYATEIPVFAFCALYAMQKVYMYHFCHIITFYSYKYTK